MWCGARGPDLACKSVNRRWTVVETAELQEDCKRLAGPKLGNEIGADAASEFTKTEGTAE
jgi:hypothetical protein